MTIHSGTSDLINDTGNPDFGHAFISVGNFTGKTMYVGKFPLPSGQYVSVGTWNGDANKKGVRYNNEFSVQDKSYYSYTVSITESKLRILSNFINDHDKWDITYNCSCFAADAWNSVVASPQFWADLGAPMIPSKLIVQIWNKTGGNYQYGWMPSNFGRSYYVDTNGNMVAM